MVEENAGVPMEEEEIMEEVAGEVTQDDKLWGLLSWLPWVGWILAIVALLIEPQKDRPFVRYHAVQSLAANVVLTVVSIILGVTVILSCVAPFIWLVLLYPAVKAYQGEWVEIPWLTDFCKNQGWI
ncbi:MAG: DUF4870 domain-containing protein [Anaerolineae bacterium]